MQKFHVIHMKMKLPGEDWKPVGGSKIYLDDEKEKMDGDLEYMRNFGPENEYKPFMFETPINSDGNVFENLVPDCIPDDIMEEIDGTVHESGAKNSSGTSHSPEADQPPSDDEPGEDDALV